MPNHSFCSGANFIGWLLCSQAHLDASNLLNDWAVASSVVLLISTRAHALVVAIDDSSLRVDEIKAISGFATGAEKVCQAQYEP